MIPRDFISEWREHAPWTTEAQVEQDLVICRALVEIFRVPHLSSHLAFRGGTALFKLHLRPAARYSEDIDLVQIAPEPIGETLSNLREVLDPWLGEPRRDTKEGNVTLTYRFLSEEIPGRQMRLKIEINPREHFTKCGHRQVRFEVQSRWWSGLADITTYSLEELLGTKLRALYQRRKGRDLFDLWYALEVGGASDEQILACYLRYVQEAGVKIRRRDFEANLSAKLLDEMFHSDMTLLFRPGIQWNVETAAAVVRDRLISKLPGSARRP